MVGGPHNMRNRIKGSQHPEGGEPRRMLHTQAIPNRSLLFLVPGALPPQSEWFPSLLLDVGINRWVSGLSSLGWRPYFTKATWKTLPLSVRKSTRWSNCESQGQWGSTSERPVRLVQQQKEFIVVSEVLTTFIWEEGVSWYFFGSLMIVLIFY